MLETNAAIPVALQDPSSKRRMTQTQTRAAKPHPDAKIVQYVASRTNAATHKTSAPTPPAKIHHKFDPDRCDPCWRTLITLNCAQTGRCGDNYSQACARDRWRQRELGEPKSS